MSRTRADSTIVFDANKSKPHRCLLMLKNKAEFLPKRFSFIKVLQMQRSVCLHRSV